ncbi:helix-turn-helix transcriptional regulator [Nocardioides halotolerans]|uniref:helix-turn-helix transcriptional regulator n=1 Tax=Nocardioides halotolerans TaxID=433660 RepID=UPI0004297A05|nr:WYL domain-containing protein [Nocardioides halotolerans]
MADTAARMLALLGLLQARSDWSGAELAQRLGVTDRTVRNDVDRLRGLGYPVDAVRGPGGRYRLAIGTKLPPLLLEEDEAVAVAVGLSAGTAVQGIEETSARALAKLEHVLPHRLQRRVNALRDAVSAGPENTGSNVEDPLVDAAQLTEVAAAIRDHVELRFDYRGDRLQLEPYRLVSWQRRWFVVARDARTGTWAPYRLDWMELRTPGGRRFSPRPLPGEDYTSFVLREVAFSGWAVHARIAVDAPAEDVLARINPTVGVVESVDADHCVLVTGGDSVEIIAVYIGMLGLDFHVTEPPELVEQVAIVGDRYRRAVRATSGTPAPGPRPGSRSRR